MLPVVTPELPRGTVKGCIRGNSEMGRAQSSPLQSKQAVWLPRKDRGREKGSLWPYVTIVLLCIHTANLEHALITWQAKH